MGDTAKQIIRTSVLSGHVAVTSIGQAGFILKDSGKRLIAVDPYLSDCCERCFGFRRLLPKILAPSDLIFDRILTTHEHYDHFDIDSIGRLMEHSGTILYASEECLKECAKLDVDSSRVRVLRCQDHWQDTAMEVQAVYCDHGDLARDAVGAVLTIEGKRIYIAGDTAYRPEQIAASIGGPVDLMIAPINGAYGNMNEEEAVRLTEKLRPGMVIPCHYRMFAEHGGDPDRFEAIIRQRLPRQKYRILSQGETMIL